VGDNDISRQFDGGGALRAWRVRGSAIYGWSSSTRWYSRDVEVDPDSKDYRVDLHLGTLIVGGEHRSGFGAAAVMPWGAILRTDRDPAGQTPDASRTTYDVGPGDLELRLRQDLGRALGLRAAWMPRLVVAVGAVAPTGPYIPKVTIVAPGDPPPVDTGRYNSLGRGVWWLVADAELFGAIGRGVGWYAALYTRTALQEAVNSFDWGSERRYAVGATWQAVPGRLAASLGADWQWRGRSTELVYDPLVGKKLRTTFISGGGDWLDLLPTVRGEIGAGVSATLTARIPLWRNVQGVQGIQNTAYFAGISYEFGAGAEIAPARPQPLAVGALPPGPLIAAALATGKPTIIDFWAEWCAPCKALTPKLEEFVKTRPDIALVRVDVTDWNQDQMDQYLPGLPGIPVVDLWTADGKLAARLVGPDCDAFATALPLPSAPE